MVKSEKYRKEDIFLDTVYDYDYYPDFLRTFLHISYTVPKQLMNEYMEAMKPQPTRNIVANYMIDPIITPKCT
ncbi:MAG: hypothetical protein LBD11_03345 [Candidatus Peribacteria bacterium]|jgi:hypothetical protein|nr:hypothetical protein [Candidatus Peribacteria bacterium]